MLSCDVREAVDVLCPVDPLHPPLIVDLSSIDCPKLQYNKTYKQNFYKANYDLINSFLAEVDWVSLFDGCKDVNELLTVFLEVINKAVLDFNPASKSKTNKYPQWYSKDLINRLREKNKIRQRYNKYKNLLDLISFKLLTQRCNKMASANYKSYLQNIEDGISKNPKLFWSYVKAKRGGTGT
ncbi:unnamed protein product [Euphydryas editha]|uniref:Uncharacterized protein n=1 Tax=Euphydryas editha TaxID=104508 RepID=A0AAU9U471_EUPED|nr:unnamed protein product [Euphydryas editha]